MLYVHILISVRCSSYAIKLFFWLHVYICCMYFSFKHLPVAGGSVRVTWANLAVVIWLGLPTATRMCVFIHMCRDISLIRPQGLCCRYSQSRVAGARCLDIKANVFHIPDRIHRVKLYWLSIRPSVSEWVREWVNECVCEVSPLALLKNSYRQFRNNQWLKTIWKFKLIRVENY